MNRLLFYIISFFITFFFVVYLYSADFQIVNIEPINTKDDDYAPSFYLMEKTLYYNWGNESQSKLIGLKINNLEKHKPQDILNVFMEKLSFVNDNITAHNLNPTYISFHNNEAYFTGKVKTKRGSTLGIYQAIFEKNNWQLTRLLDELRVDRFNFHPTISPSGNILVYCSADPSNPVDSDLMIAYRDEKNNWSSTLPLNILNSNFSEITPFFAGDDTLYFASNGLDGRGGFDIFYSVFENGNWQKPIPVQDINTEWDESDFCKLNDNLSLFVSNRLGGKGGLDIWGYNRFSIESNLDEPIFQTSLNTTTLNIVKYSKYIQLLDNGISQIPTDRRYRKEGLYYFIFQDTISSTPSHIEIRCNTNLTKNNDYHLSLQVNGNQLISQNISTQDTSFLIPVHQITTSSNILDKLEIKSIYKINEIEQTFINEVDVYKSYKELVETYEIENMKYKMIVVPIPKEINIEKLEKSLQFLQHEVKFKNGKIIVELSPTFELYDIEKIHSFLNKLNINNNAIIHQIKVNKNLSKYFNNLNFDYLLVYLQI